MRIWYSKQSRARTRIVALATLAFLLVLTLALTAAAQEIRPPLAPQPSSTNDFHIYLPTMRTPPPPYALQFDGLDDFASIVDKGDYNFEEALTVEAWIRPLSIPQEASTWVKGLVVGAGLEPPGASLESISWGLFQNESHLTRQWEEVSFFVCCRQPGNGYHAVAWGPLQVGRWAHFAGTYEGRTGDLRIYHNGELAYHWVLAGIALREVNFVLIGMTESAFHGLIDEVRIWNLARTPEQIQADWNRSLRGDEPGLVGYWRLDEGSGQAIMDSSPRLNDGRLGSTTGPDQNDPVWVVSDAPLQ